MDFSGSVSTRRRDVTTHHFLRPAPSERRRVTENRTMPEQEKPLRLWRRRFKAAMSFPLSFVKSF